MGVLPSREFNFPVISVGNISVGGTGKTPHIEYLVKLLNQDFNVATLSRGYKRKTRRFMMANLSSTTEEIGDEPRQIKQKFPHVTVAVERDRVKGIKKLIKEKNDIDVILLDDAYQHRYVKPGINILLIDYNHMIKEDYLLPMGRLREPAYESHRANVIIITKCPEKIKPIEKRIITKEINPYPYQRLYFTSLKYGELKPVFPNPGGYKSKTNLKEAKPQVLMVSGIANPRPLKRQIRGITTKISELHFRDHHYYTLKDLERIMDMFKKIENPSKAIITTEKDAMRFQNLKEVPPGLKKNLYYIPVEVHFLQDEALFNKQLYDYVKKNKKIGELIQK
jgi:tetraacyldisaccharide 4'-kinase